MFGKNPKRKPTKGDGLTLDVQEIFPTLQGEGPLVGVPSIFLRLGGCNLACDFCDTEFESFTSITLDEILSQVALLSLNTDDNEQKERVRHLIVLTGGEPFRQPISPLCDALLKAGFDIQIETNGTLYRDIHPNVQIVCSPKIVAGNYVVPDPRILARCQALKFLVSASNQRDYHGVPLWATEDANASYEIFVQPMDEYDPVKNKQNKERALSLCEKEGYRLSLQLHKLLGIA